MTKTEQSGQGRTPDSPPFMRPHATRRAVLAGISTFAGLMAAASLAATIPNDDPDIITVKPFPKGGNFRLQSSKGPLELESLRGNVVLLFFGYITCPDICPTTLGTLQQAAARLTPDERRLLRVAFISVDPDRDTLPVLDAYTSAFPVRAVGLTGPKNRIDEVADLYGAQYARVEMPGSAMRYGIEHSAAVYLIDPRGRLRLLLRHTAPPTRYATEVRRLLSGA